MNQCCAQSVKEGTHILNQMPFRVFAGAVFSELKKRISSRVGNYADSSADKFSPPGERESRDLNVLCFSLKRRSSNAHARLNP